MKIIKEAIELLCSEAVEYCRGRNWLVRFPLLLGFLYIFIRHLFNPGYSDILGPLNLGIHELGHLLFSPFGQFINILGGTLFELFAPLFGVINFYRQEDFFAVTLSFGWLATALFGVARYVGDAGTMNLPLAALFGMEDVVHDWNYLLNRLNIIGLDVTLGFFIRCLAVIFMLICLGSGSWLLWQMKKTP
ncbi:MAG: hypothetical protein Q8L26_01260 [Candidatus Omnitrophota bacterium]|nr:hypothetical protein [Candidatus Omnitrophota bacterium]